MQLCKIQHLNTPVNPWLKKPGNKQQNLLSDLLLIGSHLAAMLIRLCVVLALVFFQVKRGVDGLNGRGICLLLLSLFPWLVFWCGETLVRMKGAGF